LDVDEEALKGVEHNLLSRGVDVFARTCDVTREENCDQAIQAVLNRYAGVDVLINNAGILIVAPAEEVKEEDWDSVMNTNAKGPFFLAQKAGRVMIQQKKGGSIINITSEVVHRVELDLGAYCPSKATLYNITKVLAAEWGKYKIRVNCLAPCFVNTAMNRPLIGDKVWYEAKLKGVPLGRHSEPEDLIGGAIFLSSDASAYITGTTILVDGGYTT
jgi:NAD(P)-dependent dehydrogenase (short-subunit alcohol dehydrogenase family)